MQRRQESAGILKEGNNKFTPFQQDGTLMNLQTKLLNANTISFVETRLIIYLIWEAKISKILRIIRISKFPR